MSHDQYDVLHWVKEAKHDMNEADRMIHAYMPFIQKETAKFMKRPVDRDNDDELSIAMIAFYEAICDYSVLRGSFLHYAALHIRSRLIDHARKEKRHSRHISYDAPEGDDGREVLINKIADTDDHIEKSVESHAAKREIAEFSMNISDFGISLTEVAERCPRQKRTLDACRRALEFVRANPGIMDDFLRTRRLPVGAIAEGSGVERKTLERHRRYMVALLLAYTNGYEIIRAHLKSVLKGGTDK